MGPVARTRAGRDGFRSGDHPSCSQVLRRHARAWRWRPGLPPCRLGLGVGRWLEAGVPTATQCMRSGEPATKRGQIGFEPLADWRSVPCRREIAHLIGDANPLAVTLGTLTRRERQHSIGELLAARRPAGQPVPDCGRVRANSTVQPYSPARLAPLRHGRRVRMNAAAPRGIAAERGAASSARPLSIARDPPGGIDRRTGRICRRARRHGARAQIGRWLAPATSRVGREHAQHRTHGPRVCAQADAGALTDRWISDAARPLDQAFAASAYFDRGHSSASARQYPGSGAAS